MTDYEFVGMLTFADVWSLTAALLTVILVLVGYKVSSRYVTRTAGRARNLNV